MSLPVLSLQNYDFSDPAQAKQYQYQLMQFLNGFISQFNTAQGQITTLNTQVSTINSEISAAAPMSVFATDLGTLTSAPTINCASAGRIYIGCAMGTANRLFTLQNLVLDAEFCLYVFNSGTHAITMAATDPSANAYTIFAYQGFGAAANKINMASGWANSVTGTDTLFLGKTILAGGTRYLALHGMGG